MIIKDFSDVYLTKEELTALKMLSRKGTLEQSNKAQFNVLFDMELKFIEFTRVKDIDDWGRSVPDKNFVRMTNLGAAYLEYLRRTKAQSSFSTIVSIASILLSTVTAVVNLLKYLTE